MRRPASSSFAPDALVFPGGGVDPADAEVDLVGADPAFDLADRAATMGLDSEAGRRACGAFHVAAVRELWEETGVLLGRPRDGVEARQVTAVGRRELLGGDAVPAVLARHGLRLDLSRLVYAAQFVTPPAYPKRFDVRFFVAALPPGQSATIHSQEAVEGGWHEPTHVLDSDRRGQVKLMPPTRLMCQQLDGCATVADALTTAPSWLPQP